MSYLFDRRVPRSSFDPRLRAPEPRARPCLFSTSDRSTPRGLRRRYPRPSLLFLRRICNFTSSIPQPPAGPISGAGFPGGHAPEPAAAGGGTGSGACGRSGRSWCSRAAERQSPVPPMGIGPRRLSTTRRSQTSGSRRSLLIRGAKAVRDLVDAARTVVSFRVL